MTTRKYRFSMEIEVPEDLHEEDILDILHDNIQQATGWLSIDDFEIVKPLDEGDLLDILLKHGDLLTCAECGDKLVEKVDTTKCEGLVAKLILDPGEINYPREPDVPASLYFICPDCANKCDNRLNGEQLKLLSSFLIGHWKEIADSKHHKAFEVILDIINPGARKTLGLV